MKSNFLGFLSLIKKEYQLFSFMLLFDVLFILLVVNIRILALGFIEIISPLLAYTPPGVQYFFSVIIFLIVMYIFILIHIVFKYLVVGKSFEILHKEKKENLKQFIKLNLMIYTPILVLLVFLIVINPTIYSWLSIQNLGRLFIPATILLIVFVIGILYLYTLINFIQVKAFNFDSIKTIIKRAFKKTTSAKVYGFYWFDIKVIIGYVIFFIIVTLIARSYLFTTTNAYVNYMGPYKSFISFTSYLIGYIILLYNRLSFVKNGSISSS
tara:strand:- start:875 stop:1678 length:804 start_codon:yes stop_codon:yes gene_type:complete